AGLEPDTLAELVRRRLTGPAQIPVEFEAQHLLIDLDPRPQVLPGQFRGPGLAWMPGRVGRDRQLRVHAEVDYDPSGAQQLRVEHSELVAGVGQEAEVVHEPL